MTQREAHDLAGRKIPNIRGSLRTCWVNGFINLPQLGVARYDRTLAAAKLRAMGVEARREYEARIKAQAADGEDPHTAARERPQGSQ